MVQPGLTGPAPAGPSAGQPPRALRGPAPVAMLTHSYYEEDPRVRREAEAIVRAGRPVDVFALRRPGDEPAGTIDGVRVHRLDVQRHQGAGAVTYLAEYLAFLVRGGLALTRAHARKRYALVQVHTLPDFLVLAALPARLAGTPVVMDLHEAMPEFFATRFPRLANPAARMALRLQERAAIAAADHVLTVNDALVDRLVGLGIATGRVTRVRNSPSLERFDPSRRPARPFAGDGTLRLVYAGALTPTYEIDVVIRAMARLADRRPAPRVELDLYGRGDSEPALRGLARDLGLADRIVFHGRIPIEDVPDAIAAADVGLAPTRQSPFTDVSLSTKVFEYAAMGKPVICSALPMVQATFPADAVWTYRPGEPGALADAILRIVDDPGARTAGVARAMEIVAAMSWEEEAAGYLAVIDDLIDRHLPDRRVADRRVADRRGADRRPDRRRR